jgi:hypothetical protein
MNSECAIAVVLFVILATGNLVIRSVDILFPVALIAAQVQFFRNTAKGLPRQSRPELAG